MRIVHRRFFLTEGWLAWPNSPSAVNRLRSASMCVGHRDRERGPTAVGASFLRIAAGALTAIWRILGGSLAIALLSAGAAIGAAPPDAARRAQRQATLSLSATLRRRRAAHGRPALAGLRRAGRPRRLASADRRIQPRPADPDAAGRATMSCMSPSASPARPSASRSAAEVRSEQLTLSAGALRIDGTLGDAPIDPSKLSLAIYVPQNRNPLGKLVYAKAQGRRHHRRAGRRPITSSRPISTRSAPFGRDRRNSGKSAAVAPPRGAADQFDRQRATSGSPPASVDVTLAIAARR